MELPKIPIGDAVEAIVDWIDYYFSWLLDAISDGLRVLVNGLNDILFAIPAPVLIVLMGVIVWFVTRHDIKMTVLTMLGLLLIWDLGLWELSMLTVVLVIIATVIALALSISDRYRGREKRHTEHDSPTISGFHADDAVICVSDSSRDFLRAWQCARHHRNSDFFHASRLTSHDTWHPTGSC